MQHLRGSDNKQGKDSVSLNTEQSRTHINISELVYLIYLSLLLGARTLGMIEGEIVYNGIFVLACLLFFVKLALTEHSILEYAIIVVVMGTALTVYHNTGEKGLILCFLLMLGMKGVQKKNVMKLSLFITFFNVLLLFFLSSVGIIPDFYYYQNRGWGGDFRHALGYPHPNSAQDWVVFLIFLAIFQVDRLFPQKILRASILCILFSASTYLYTGSRTGLLISGIFLLVNMLIMTSRCLGRTWRVILLTEYPSLAFVSVVIPKMKDTGLLLLMEKIDGDLAARVNEGIYWWTTSGGLCLFGHRFSYAQHLYGIDNSYLFLLLNLGAIPFLLISMLYMFYIADAIRDDRRGELSITFSLLLMGMVDPLLFNMSTRNLIFLFAGDFFYRKTTALGKTRELTLKECNKIFANRNALLPGGVHQITISMNMMNKFYNFKVLAKRSVGNTSVFYKQVLLFLGGFIFCAGIYSIGVKKPTIVYSNQNKTELGIPATSMAPIYISENKVREIRDSGDLVIGYEDETTPMYEYSENVPFHEYLRRMMKFATFTGVCTMIGGDCAIKRLKKHKNLL